MIINIVLSEKAYANQIFSYIKNKEYEKALNTALDMHSHYPKSYISNIAVSKAYFWLGRNANAEKYALKAISASKNRRDTDSARLLLAIIYVQDEQFKKAYDMLDKIPRSTLNPIYWELKVILDLILDKNSSQDFKRLYAINYEAAEHLLLDILIRYKF